MKSKPVFFVIAFFIVSWGAPTLSLAQDDDGASLSGAWQYAAFTNTSECRWGNNVTTLEDVSDNFEDIFVMIEHADGSLTAVFSGDDIHYEPVGDGTYSGSYEFPDDPANSFASVLRLSEGGNLLEEGTIQIGDSCTYTFTNEFQRPESLMYQIFTETDREFSDLSFFNECLGREGVEPGGAWLADKLVAVGYDEGADAYLIGARRYEADGSLYTNYQEESANEYVTTQTLTLKNIGEETIDTEGFFQLNERADCVVAYTSQLLLLDLDEWEAFHAEIMAGLTEEEE